MISMSRLLAVSRKEWIHVMRDWRSLVLVIAIPMVLILLFGYALDMDLKKVPTIVWDQSRTPESREFLSNFDGSPYFSITESVETYRDIQHAIDSSRAMMALVIPVDFSARIGSNTDVSVQLIVDGSDANTARLALSYATALAQIYSQRVNMERVALMGQHDLAVPVELVQRAWYNQDLRSQNYIIPGILAVVMMVIAAMMTSITVAREWETGTMEQLISTPVRGPEIVFGKVIPYFVIGIVDVAIAVAMGQWVFDVPLRGSPGLIFAMAAIFLAGALFFGLTISIVTKAQVLANQIALLSGFLPTMLLSGFVFAIENMPLPIQILTYIVPARYFITLLRGIYLKGIGLEVMWLNAVLLSVYALIMVVAANRNMKFKLE
ncbi:MAG: ABC transporter permease [Desulfomonilia bacterium]